MRKGPPVIRLALLLALLLGSLTLVVWRQSQALVLLRDLDGVRRERVVEEARRSALVRRIEELESRAHVSALAGRQLGMRLPTGSEIVILPMREPTPARLVADAGAAAGAAGAAGDQRRVVASGG